MVYYGSLLTHAPGVLRTGRDGPEVALCGSQTTQRVGKHAPVSLEVTPPP